MQLYETKKLYSQQQTIYTLENVKLTNIFQNIK